MNEERVSELTPRPSDSEEILWKKIHEYMRVKLGVTSILYGFTHSKYTTLRVGLTNCLYIKNSHPAEYIEYFSNERFLDDDFCTFVLWGELGPFFWHEVYDRDTATPEQIERARIDERFGLNAGVSIGFRFADGHGISGIGLACRWMDPEEFRDKWMTVSGEIMEYLNIFDPLMRETMVRSRMCLSPKQIEVLSLSIGGMKGKQIASRLGVTEGRVEKVFKEIREKLHADTTQEAAAKAIAYKLL